MRLSYATHRTRPTLVNLPHKKDVFAPAKMSSPDNSFRDEIDDGEPL